MRNLLLSLSFLFSAFIATETVMASDSSRALPLFHCSPADIVPGVFDAGVRSMNIFYNRVDIYSTTIAGERVETVGVTSHKLINGFAGPIHLYTLENGAEINVNIVLASGSAPFITAVLIDKESEIRSAHFRNCERNK